MSKGLFQTTDDIFSKINFSGLVLEILQISLISVLEDYPEACVSAGF